MRLLIAAINQHFGAGPMQQQIALHVESLRGPVNRASLTLFERRWSPKMRRTLGCQVSVCVVALKTSPFDVEDSIRGECLLSDCSRYNCLVKTPSGFIPCSLFTVRQQDRIQTRSRDA